ncbi:MAG TPA: ATP-binding cassette domain-containing protein [Thermoanaerobaculia bacterium]|jgi:ATP-binding cassette subfamily B protein|nr:ATP-binding cassette domain-containing protein [Thermoanaerobaculia bacterium]
MSAATADTAGPMFLRFSIPGRERWVIEGLLDRPDVAGQIELILRNEQGVEHVKANAVTGTLLLEFEGTSPMQREAVRHRVMELLERGARASTDIELKSAVPGRVRFKVAAIAGSPAMAALVVQTLGEEDGVLEVSANAVTGSVVLRFDPDHRVPRDVVLQRVSEARRRIDDGEFVALPHPGPRRGLPAPVYWATAGALIAAPHVLGLAATPFILGATFVGAAITTAYGVYHFLRKRIVEDTDSGRALHRLLEHLRPFRRQFLIATVCSVIRKIVDFAPPIFIGMAVNIAAGTPSALFAAIGITSLGAQITALGITAWLVYIVESTFEYQYKSRWRKLAQDVQHKMRVEAYAHAQLVQMRYLEDESTGNLTAILNDNINQLQLFLDDGVNALLEIVTNVAVIVVAFAILAPEVAWIALLPLPIIAWIAVGYHKRIGPIYQDVHRRTAQVSSLLVNNFTGISTIRSFGTEEREARRLESMSAGYLSINREAIDRFAAFEPTARIPIQTTFAALVIAGGHRVLAGTISDGAYASVLFLLPRFLFPFAYFGHTIDRYQRAMAAVQRVFDLLDKPIGPEGGDVRLPRERVRGEISFDNVDFGYRSGVPVLSHFNLDVEAGKTIGVVGQTGSGKTTLVKLLLRFYDPRRGRILLDGHDVRELTSRDLRNSIGLVSQDVYLFDGTIRENISYGSAGASMAEVERAAQLAEATQFIERLPNGYDETVGERGMKLSGGQRQRISLARAILKNPPILILDEATAALDNETEAAIQRSLAKITHQRTTIVIAHRLSTIRNADRIVVLGNGGTVVESGTHEELLEQDNVYASLWRVQTGEPSEKAG